ncbi:MAG: putative pyridoxamine 5'-phosphate oxidase family protein, partial [Candidatus Azotimanducaceae bacterium]
MKILKILGSLIAVYVFVVVGFESLLGYFQPANEQTLALIVTEDDGNPHQRVLSRIEHEGKLYVAVNHWPRAWYRALQEEPGVTVAFNDASYSATAVVVS